MLNPNYQSFWAVGPGKPDGIWFVCWNTLIDKRETRIEIPVMGESSARRVLDMLNGFVAETDRLHDTIGQQRAALEKALHTIRTRVDWNDPVVVELAALLESTKGGRDA